MYQKEIIYMSLYKDGNRLGNAGFLKVEKRGRERNLTLTVKNAPRTINGKFPVRYYNGTDWKETDGIAVREGGGKWEKKEEDSLERVSLQILLPGGYLIEGTSKTAENNTVKERENASPEKEKRAEAMPREAAEIQEAADQGAKAEEKPGRQSKQVEYIAVERPRRQEAVAAQEKAPVREVQRAQHSMSLPPMEGLKEDKWEQILDTYDGIHPYGDERLYVKLEPKDFLILSSKYQHLVNNSFLLHGFYNYRHVILGKEKETYYLGVPGVFYEREKMVALMFGFEAFECASGEPEAGEFGYYLRQVEL